MRHAAPDAPEISAENAPLRHSADSEAHADAGNADAAPSPPAPASRAAVRSALGLLLVLTGIHFLVDTVAGTVSPLWPKLGEQYRLGESGVLAMYVVWTLSTSITQSVFAYCGDRWQRPWMLWAGPAVGVLGVSCIGLTDSPWLGGLLLVVGGLGVSAFHPEAAAAASGCFPSHRSRAMSIFSIGGYLGQALGPCYAGFVVDGLGMSGLAVGVAWGLATLALLAWGLTAARLPAPPRRARVSLRALIAGKELLLATVLVVGLLRVVPAMGIPIGVAFLLQSRGYTTTGVGLVQMVFMVGLGAGSLACALWLPRRWERTALWLLPLALAPLCVLVPFADGPVLVACVGLAGWMLGLALPVLIGYGQQLLPEGQRIASSITMGLSWGLGAGLVAAGLFAGQRAGSMPLSFCLFAAASVLSGLLSRALPDAE